MRFAVVAVGRIRSPHFAAAADDYAKRLGRYGSLERMDVRDVTGRSQDDTRLRESNALIDACPKGSLRVALDERGELLTSAELARRLERAAVEGDGAWSFLVGGAEGHHPTLRTSAAFVWALSPLTLPHELARVVLLEQLYRAMTIIRGEAYHRE